LLTAILLRTCLAGRVQGPLQAMSTFREGDEVEVWSKGKERWLRGRITIIAKPSGSCGAEGSRTAPVGSVKVTLGNVSKWLHPSEFECLRHCVAWEMPVDPEVPPFSCLRAVRRKYFATKDRTRFHDTGAEHQLRIGLTALEKIWQAAVEEDVPTVPSTAQERDLIHLRVKKSFEDLNVSWFLGHDDMAGSVDLFDWLHHTLMRLHPPGPEAAKRVADELAAAGPKTLSVLVTRWMRMDKSGSGLISKDDLTEAFREEFWPKLSLRVAEKMAVSMLRELDTSGFGKASYSEFVLRCLGVECSEVVLYYYDLSNDWAKYLSPLLLGSWEGGLWHTGISAFGREYFYGGRICWGPPGATVWGKPTRAMRLGLTTRSLDKLREYIFINLDRKYDPKSYDVLDHNCNHFVDEASRFLLGSGIPDEVRLQPQRLMGAPVARMFRPLLNRWLGRVEETKKPPEEADKSKKTEGDVRVLNNSKIGENVNKISEQHTVSIRRVSVGGA